MIADNIYFFVSMTNFHELKEIFQFFPILSGFGRVWQIPTDSKVVPREKICRKVYLWSLVTFSLIFESKVSLLRP